MRKIVVYLYYQTKTTSILKIELGLIPSLILTFTVTFLLIFCSKINKKSYI
nr:MAG TPA: hypothetical protein [Caudoviricetes sp.]